MMKNSLKFYLIVAIAYIALGILVTSVYTSEGIRIPVAPEGTAGAKNVTGTTIGDHYGMDVNLTGGSITLTTPAYSVTSGEFKICTIAPMSASACNLTSTSTMFIIFNGSTTDTIYANPYGTASATSGFPITKSSVAYDHYFGLSAFNNKNWSIYNAGSATTTIMLMGGK